MIKESSISTIFWDAGGVLFSDVQISQPEFEPVLTLLGINQATSDEIFNSLWPEKVRLGKMTENDYWEEYIKRSQRKPTIQEVKMLYRACIRCNERVLEITQELSQLYNQYILSNQGKEWMDFLIKHWKLDRWFKGFFCSAYLGIAKPDKRFYETALEKTKRKIEEVLYIDNSEQNIQAAGELGIRGLFYEDTKKIKTSLERSGIIFKTNDKKLIC